MERTVHRTCHLCEAGCGLVLSVEDQRIVSVTPDPDDPSSAGYACPKGIHIAGIHDDPDRLRQPLRKMSNGEFQPIGWDEAFDLIGSKLNAIRDEHGADSLALYFGNPLGHNYAGIMMLGALTEAIGSKNRMSASSQDTAPRFAASYYLYGNTLVLPVPDIEKTDYFLCIGANPVVSQGSILVAPDIKRRLKAITARGGRIVTVDPRFTETSKIADEHVFIRPGGDAAFLFALANELLVEELVDTEVMAELATGWEVIEEHIREITPARAEAISGVAADTVRRLARALASAEAPVVYTRIGTCNNAHGTLATYLNDVLNLMLGALGKNGGVLFPEPPLDGAMVVQLGKMNGHARWRSRVRGLPEIQGDLPASILAEEIETPGQGQVRALITVAGNPVLSTPNGRRLDAALERLEFQVAVDLYINETTRHADVILPPSWALTEGHTSALAANMSVYTRARFDPPVIEKEEGEWADWEIMYELAKRMGGGPTGLGLLDKVYGLLEFFGVSYKPANALDMFMRIGPHGDRFMPFGVRRNGINLEKIKANRYGIDLGRAREGVTHRIYHKDKKVHLDAPPILETVSALLEEMDRGRAPDEVLLIGRRELRSNNSWMHNVPGLVSGRERCVLFVHPDDAAKAGLRDSEPAELESDVYRGEVPVRVTDEVMPGVVSLPHGWGHEPSADWQSVAGERPGVSANDWTNDQKVEAVVGQSILNGVPVKIRRGKSGRVAA